VEKENEWDDFVLHKSMNGTFLQTRAFINYHPQGKFEDCSLCIRKGEELVATILACMVIENGKRTFFAHKGSTYGGICVSPSIYSATAMDEIVGLIIQFIREQGIDKIYLKMVPDVYQKKNTDLVDYFLYKNGFICYNELNYYMHLQRYKEDIASQFTSGKRRDYRYSLKNNFSFQELTTREEIAEYYDVLQLNLKKLGLSSVHSLDELYDLKFNRFPEDIAFYGVFMEGKIIAGSMLFYFGDKVVHTQYLSSNENYLRLFPMDFLIYHLIQVALNRNAEIFTFGICTEDQGRYLNLGLSQFKEGFGTEFCINRSYELTL